MFLSGCGRFFVPAGNGSGGSGSSGTETVYVANSNAGAGNSDSISVLSVGSSGVLTALGANVPAGTGVSCMAVAGNFLYAGNFGGGGGVFGFSIGSGGGLTALNSGSLFAPGAVPQSLGVAGGGKYLYVLDISGASSTSAILLYDVNTATGALSGRQSGQPVSYTVNAGSPISIRVSPNGSNLYAALGQLHGIQPYTINNDGTLTALPAVPIANPDFVSAYDIGIDPHAAFAYVSDNVNGKVVSFSVQSDGSLQRITNGAYAAGTAPIGVMIDPSGGHLFVGNNGSSNVNAYTIAVDGTLSAISGSPYAAGSGPRGILADPTGQWVYVANQGGTPDLSVFSEANTGVLSSIGSVRTGGSAIAVAAVKR